MLGLEKLEMSFLDTTWALPDRQLKGNLYLTNFRLIQISATVMAGKKSTVSIWVPLVDILNIERKVREKENQLIRISCKDFQMILLAINSQTDASKIWDYLIQFVCPQPPSVLFAFYHGLQKTTTSLIDDEGLLSLSIFS